MTKKQNSKPYDLEDRTFAFAKRVKAFYIQFVNVALGSVGENYSQMLALLKSEEISKDRFDEFDKRHYSVENKLINLAKSLGLEFGLQNLINKSL